MVSTLERMQVENGTGPEVRRSKCPLLASQTRCKCPMACMDTSLIKVITSKTVIRSSLLTSKSMLSSCSQPTPPYQGTEFALQDTIVAISRTAIYWPQDIQEEANVYEKKIILNCTLDKSIRRYLYGRCYIIWLFWAWTSILMRIN